MIIICMCLKINPSNHHVSVTHLRRCYNAEAGWGISQNKFNYWVISHIVAGSKSVELPAYYLIT